MRKDLDFIQKVKLFNEIGGTKNEYNVKKLSLYFGLIAEEFSELLQSFNNESWDDTIYFFDDMSTKFKEGTYDKYFDSLNFNKVDALDAIVDIAVVALGAGIAMGVDVDGACHAVADNNLTKFPIVDGKHTVLYDENGKIKKPLGFKSVELTSFVK